MLDDAARTSLNRLAELLEAAERTVVLTGAGVSTESGLPDYRGSSGLWRNKRFEELASIEQFRREPVEFWDFYRQRLDGLRDATPNPGHHALARLEQAGYVRALVTQNVDGLHRAAGSRNVLEVHGSLAEMVCTSCRSRARQGEQVDHLYPASDLAAHADASGVPRCANEGCSAVLKPNVVLFGEMLPDDFDVATSYVYDCDLLLACGSSLAVVPVALFPHWAKHGGARLAIVNQGETECDDLADVRVEAKTAAALSYLADRLA